MNYEIILNQLRTQRDNTNHQVRVWETKAALEAIQKIGQIMAVPKGGLGHFPMPFDASYTIYPDPPSPKLVLEGGAGPSGWGEARVAIDFTQSAVEELLKEYDLHLQVMEDEDFDEAKGLAEQLLWLKISV